MQRHRDAAQTAAVHRKLKDDPRMAYVQTILHSVQVIYALMFQLSSWRAKYVPTLARFCLRIRTLFSFM